jgi:iduronate 2-sulfatase
MKLLPLLFLISGLWSLLSAAERRPNILFIAVDDLRPELHCFGAEHIISPHIDKLAATGTAFLGAHCQQAVCSPSRSSLMTGLRPDSTKVWDLNTHFRKAVPDVVTLPQHFKAHGYHAVSMGKIYHGGFDDAPSWSEPALKAGGSRYVLPENIQLIKDKQKAAKAEGVTGKKLSRAARGPATECADVPDEDYTVWVDSRDHDKILFTELYDHKKDPRENENVAPDPANAEILKKLEHLRQQGWQGTRQALNR